MIVDQDLVDAAKDLLAARFPDQPGQATAMYSLTGRMYLGASMSTASESSVIEPETGPIAEANRDSELIGASVTVGWHGPDTPVRYLTPSGITLDRLTQAAWRDAQIVVHDFFEPERVRVKLLRDLVPHHCTDQLIEGRFVAGMRSIRAELIGHVRERGLPAVRDGFGPMLRQALRDPVVRRWARTRSFAPDPADFVLPVHLSSVSLRHIHHAFFMATSILIDTIVTEIAPRLHELGANDPDVMHVTQGGEAFRYAFGNLLVFIGTGGPIRNELPFRPYHSEKLDKGLPLHEFLALSLDDSADGRGHNLWSVREVVRLLDPRSGETNNYLAYLRQRHLYTVDVFRGRGPGHCPFATFADEVLIETSKAIGSAVAAGDVLLDDHPPSAGRNPESLGE